MSDLVCLFIWDLCVNYDEIRKMILDYPSSHKTEWTFLWFLTQNQFGLVFFFLNTCMCIWHMVFQSYVREEKQPSRNPSFPPTIPRRPPLIIIHCFSLFPVSQISEKCLTIQGENTSWSTKGVGPCHVVFFSFFCLWKIFSKCFSFFFLSLFAGRKDIFSPPFNQNIHFTISLAQ